MNGCWFKATQCIKNIFGKMSIRNYNVKYCTKSKSQIFNHFDFNAKLIYLNIIKLVHIRFFSKPAQT